MNTTKDLSIYQMIDKILYHHVPHDEFRTYFRAIKHAYEKDPSTISEELITEFKIIWGSEMPQANTILIFALHQEEEYSPRARLQVYLDLIPVDHKKTQYQLTPCVSDIKTRWKDMDNFIHDVMVMDKVSITIVARALSTVFCQDGLSHIVYNIYKNYSKFSLVIRNHLREVSPVFKFGYQPTEYRTPLDTTDGIVVDSILEHNPMEFGYADNRWDNSIIKTGIDPNITEDDLEKWFIEPNTKHPYHHHGVYKVDFTNISPTLFDNYNRTIDDWLSELDGDQPRILSMVFAYMTQILDDCPSFMATILENEEFVDKINSHGFGGTDYAKWVLRHV